MLEINWLPGGRCAEIHTCSYFRQDTMLGINCKPKNQFSRQSKLNAFAFNFRQPSYLIMGMQPFDEEKYQLLPSSSQVLYHFFAVDKTENLERRTIQLHFRKSSVKICKNSINFIRLISFKLHQLHKMERQHQHQHFINKNKTMNF